MDTESHRFVGPGALIDANINVVRCTHEDELRSVLAFAQRARRPLSLMSGKRSFAHQCLPVDGGIAVDLSAFEPRIEVLEEESDGSRIWVRVSGSTRFCELKERFRGFRVLRPPTSDHITVAGAFSACSHKATGYFADSVRAFRLVLPTGEAVECCAESTGLSRELYWSVPGSFGALGVIVSMDLELYPLHPKRLMATRTMYSGSSADGRYLDVLEATKNDPAYPEGAGALIYGKRGHVIVLGTQLLPKDFVPRGRPAVLTGDNLRQQALAHALANRYPQMAQHFVRNSLKKNSQAWAPWYGFQFYQRSYDRTHQLLDDRGIHRFMARILNVDPRVPVLHQAWFFPQENLREMMDLYFNLMDEYSGIERRCEQQDLILLPPCQWPAHSTGGATGPTAALTASFSVAHLNPDKRLRIVGFLRRVSREAHRRFPEVRVSLSKQIHCAPDVLRSMHSSWIALIGGLRSRVDPGGILLSRHLEILLGSSNSKVNLSA